MSISDPLTIKLVSRNIYIFHLIHRGSLLNGYRANIGADFITKSLPNPLDPENRTGVVLQIWVRSFAHFHALHGLTDVVILMYDVFSPKSLPSMVERLPGVGASARRGGGLFLRGGGKQGRC
ncbi:hypothetical protein FIBSPDRAFT_1023506, partial [Athelia psychrophila]